MLYKNHRQKYEKYNLFELMYLLNKSGLKSILNKKAIIDTFVDNKLKIDFDDNDNDNDNDDVNMRLTEEEVNRIPLITIQEELEDSCSICLENIEIGSMVYSIPCNHKFHINCLKSNLINYNRNCPLCRNECFSNIN